MTDLDPKHLDALLEQLRPHAGHPGSASHQAADAITALRAENDRLSNLWQIEHDHATALRAQIDQERAATIEAAAQWHMDRIAEANRQIAENNEYLAREGLTHSEANERCRESVWNSRIAIRAIRAMHTDATRAAMDAIRREGYEAGVKNAAETCDYIMEGAKHFGVSNVANGAMFCRDEVRKLAASIPPDPDTNAG